MGKRDSYFCDRCKKVIQSVMEDVIPFNFDSFQYTKPGELCVPCFMELKMKLEELVKEFFSTEKQYVELTTESNPLPEWPKDIRKPNPDVVFPIPDDYEVPAFLRKRLKIKGVTE